MSTFFDRNGPTPTNFLRILQFFAADANHQTTIKTYAIHNTNSGVYFVPYWSVKLPVQIGKSAKNGGWRGGACLWRVLSLAAHGASLCRPIRDPYSFQRGKARLVPLPFLGGGSGPKRGPTASLVPCRRHRFGSLRSPVVKVIDSTALYWSQA